MLLQCMAVALYRRVLGFAAVHLLPPLRPPYHNLYYLVLGRLFFVISRAAGLPPLHFSAGQFL